jgi:hypothetical protein
MDRIQSFALAAVPLAVVALAVAWLTRRFVQKGSRGWCLPTILVVLAIGVPWCGTTYANFDLYSRRKATFSALETVRRDYPGCLAVGACDVEDLERGLLHRAVFAVQGHMHRGRDASSDVLIPDEVATNIAGGVLVAATSAGIGRPPDVWLVSANSVSLLVGKDQLSGLTR